MAADSLIAQDVGDASILGDKVALGFLDWATEWIDTFPFFTTDAAHALAEFLGNGQLRSL